MRIWQPHVDLQQLSDALSEEIIAAPEEELCLLHAESGYSIAGAAQDVRSLIAAASGEPDCRAERVRTAVALICLS